MYELYSDLNFDYETLLQKIYEGSHTLVKWSLLIVIEF